MQNCVTETVFSLVFCVDLTCLVVCGCWTDTSRVVTTRLWSSVGFWQQSLEPLDSVISAELHQGYQSYLLDVKC